MWDLEKVTLVDGDAATRPIYHLVKREDIPVGKGGGRGGEREGGREGGRGRGRGERERERERER